MSFDIDDKFTIVFLSLLRKHGVRYMLIGGVAVNFHGYSRNTQDLDVWLAPTNENRDLFYKVLLDLDYSEGELSDLKDEDFTKVFKCTLGDMPDTIYCLTYVHPNISFDNAEQVMLTHDIGDGVIINVVNYDFLRQMKILTHRPQDWADVSKLDEIKKKT